MAACGPWSWDDAGRQIYMSWKQRLYLDRTACTGLKDDSSRRIWIDGCHKGTITLLCLGFKKRRETESLPLSMCDKESVATAGLGTLRMRGQAFACTHADSRHRQTGDNTAAYVFRHIAALTPPPPPPYTLSYPGRMPSLAALFTPQKIHSTVSNPSTNSPVIPTSFATQRPTAEHCCSLDYLWPCFCWTRSTGHVRQVTWCNIVISVVIYLLWLELVVCVLLWTLSAVCRQYLQP